jgi:chromosome partitioning protein
VPGKAGVLFLWDLDPQAAASFYFRVKPHIKKGAKGIVRKLHPLQEHIKGTNYPGLDIISTTQIIATTRR